MKKIISIILVTIVLAQAKGVKRYGSMLEIAPKASFYISSDAYLGIGGECVINPVKQAGIRITFSEAVFGNGTYFYLNSDVWVGGGLSLDGLFYIPMAGLEPYVHGGLGFFVQDPPGQAGTNTFFSFRFGMGLHYFLNPKTKFFVEPGIIVYDAHDTEAMFRLSTGVRFGVL
ncbi:MAG: hypothetical protein N3A65_00190 [candidate division WOR-3 bacterium]|nr:hypothetical protein [candidate division WOR-3 bacterium]